MVRFRLGIGLASFFSRLISHNQGKISGELPGGDLAGGGEFVDVLQRVLYDFAVTLRHCHARTHTHTHTCRPVSLHDH